MKKLLLSLGAMTAVVAPVAAVVACGDTKDATVSTNSKLDQAKKLYTNQIAKSKLGTEEKAALTAEVKAIKTEDAMQAWVLKNAGKLVVLPTTQAARPMHTQIDLDDLTVNFAANPDSLKKIVKNVVSRLSAAKDGITELNFSLMKDGKLLEEAKFNFATSTFKDGGDLTKDETDYFTTLTTNHAGSGLTLANGKLKLVGDTSAVTSEVVKYLVRYAIASVTKLEYFSNSANMLEAHGSGWNYPAATATPAEIAAAKGSTLLGLKPKA